MTGYLGLGSNVGDRRENLQRAVTALPFSVLACSSTYDTDPVGEVLDQPSFLNACVSVECGELGAEAVLDACKQTERELGRLDGARHGPRVIDIDLLLLGDLTHVGTRLTLPHAQVLSRRFVLIPLLELDWQLRTPDGSLLSEALAGLALEEGVRLAGPPLVS